MKFSQLIEYNMRYFLENHTRNVGVASPTPFYKKSKSSISLDQQSKML